MPSWMQWALLAVFSTHFAVFSRLFVVRREPYYALVSLTFLLLMTAFCSALFVPDITALYWYPRILAWITAAISLGWFLRRRLRKSHPSQEASPS